MSIDKDSTVEAAEGQGANAAIFISSDYMEADSNNTVNNITIKGTISGSVIVGDVTKDGVVNNIVVKREYGDKVTAAGYYFTRYSGTDYIKLYDEKPASSSGGSHSVGGAEGKNEEIEEFWEDVEQQIKSADDGDTVRVNAKLKDQMPYTVMNALRNNLGVSLTVRWDEGTVTIPAGKALIPEGNRIYYPLDYLAKVYERIEAEPVVKQQPAAPIVQYDKPIYQPAAPSVPVEDKQQPASAEKPEVKEPEITQPEIKQPEVSSSEMDSEVVTVAPAEVERMSLSYPIIAAIVGGIALLLILIVAIVKMRKGIEY